MATRRPAPRAFVVVRANDGSEVPGLLLGWVHGTKGRPTDWYARVVVRSIDLDNNAAGTEQLVHADDVRPATAADVERDWPVVAEKPWLREYED